MGRLDFILEYQEYIKKVLNLSEKDDEHIYEEYKKWRIVEGLIKTHPSNKSSEIISKRFTELESNDESDGKIYVAGYFKELEKYIPLFNNLGYFISEVTFNGVKWTKDFSEKSKPIAIFLEPKYDFELQKLPNVLYHTTLLRYQNSINRYGLVPKSHSKLTKHPDRIYFTDDFYIASRFGEYLKKENGGEPYSIYKIETNGLNINLYRDVNLVDAGFYTLDNFPNKCINKIV